MNSRSQRLHQKQNPSGNGADISPLLYSEIAGNCVTKSTLTLESNARNPEKLHTILHLTHVRLDVVQIDVLGGVFEEVHWNCDYAHQVLFTDTWARVRPPAGVEGREAGVKNVQFWEKKIFRGDSKRSELNACYIV